MIQGFCLGIWFGYVSGVLCYLMLYIISEFLLKLLFLLEMSLNTKAQTSRGDMTSFLKTFCYETKIPGFFFWPVVYKYSATSQNTNISLLLVRVSNFSALFCCGINCIQPMYLSDANATAFLLMLFQEEYRKRGFQEVVSPNIYSTKLWETSGHWQHYSVRH